MVLAGDCRQTLPVLPNRSMQVILNSSVFAAEFWNEVQIVTLRKNMRALSDSSENRDFAEFLELIGNGQVGEIGAGNCGGGFVALENFRLVQDKLRALNIAFPQINSPSSCVKRAIICGTNARCDDFNDLAICELAAANEATGAAARQGHVKISSSVSSLFSGPCYKGATNNQPNVETRNFLEGIDSGQAPRHELSLCVGALCLLVRAISPMDVFAKIAA